MGTWGKKARGETSEWGKGSGAWREDSDGGGRGGGGGGGGECGEPGSCGWRGGLIGAHAPDENEPRAVLRQTKAQNAHAMGL